MAFIAGSLVPSVVENAEDWSLGDTLLTRIANVPTSVRVNFTPIQTGCRELIFSVLDKAGDVLRLEL